MTAPKPGVFVEMKNSDCTLFYEVSLTINKVLLSYEFKLKVIQLNDMLYSQPCLSRTRIFISQIIA